MQSTMNRTSRVSQAPAQYDLQADIQELRKLLSASQEDPRRQRFRNLYDTIQVLIAAGVSHAAIIRKLKSMDLNISPVTFKKWFTEIQRARDGAAAGNLPGAEVSQVRDAMRRGTA